MIKSINEIIQAAKECGNKKIAVAAAQDIEVLSALCEIKKLGIADAILVGDKACIKKIGKDNNLPINQFELINEKDISKASMKAVELVSTGKADMVMKGLVDTSIFLKAVLHKGFNLKSDKIISGTVVFEVPGYSKLVLVTDPAVNIEPDLNSKKRIIDNAVFIAKKLDIEVPMVGVLCAKEKVNPKMQATVDAKTLEDMNRKGEITDCIVGGPLALDNIVSEEAAIAKGINNPVAGKADIILTPNIDTGNSLVKSMIYFAGANYAVGIVGTNAPIIITSRSDSFEAKVNSIALSVLMTKSDI